MKLEDVSWFVSSHHYLGKLSLVAHVDTQTASPEFYWHWTGIALYYGGGIFVGVSHIFFLLSFW